MKFKTLLSLLLAAGLGFALATLWLGRQQSISGSDQLATSPTIPEIQKEDSGDRSEKGRSRNIVTPSDMPTTEVAAPKVRGPQEILDELATIQVTPGPGLARAQYRILALMDQLAQAGSSALPAIRQFLASNRDVAYTSQGNRGGGVRNIVLPPSLRFGLFDVVRQIGGAEGEQALAESLNTTVQGAELVYLAQLLEEMAPGKYRDAALTVARNLLAGGKITDPADRNSLYDVLRQFNDTSFVSTAQAQLVQPDGRVDRSALRYLQQTLGEQSLTIAAQLFQDKRVADAESKESLGRLALTYVGANDQALQLYHTATMDPALKPDHRRNLIEDLNQDGLSNTRNPTPEDLKLIASRYALTQSYLQQEYVQNDKLLNAAFREADKDLAKMLQRAGVALPAPTPVK